MIVRTSEAWVRPGARDEFMRVLRDMVATFRDRYPGLVTHEIMVDRDDADRVIYRSTWLDEDAVAGFAGDDWATSPVTFPDEQQLLREPLRLRHFVTDDIPDSGEDFTPLE